MGFQSEMVVMEIGYDDDVDDELRAQIEAHVGAGLVNEDSDEVIDVVLLWYREDDGDLGDLLVDAIRPLADDGFIWLLTPKRGRGGYVEPSDIAEASSVAGLSQTSITTAGTEWSAARLTSRKSTGAKR
ncbi:MAG: DUF3052 domain-containing protein [Pseudonocardiales bacterium]|nr:DUF3052 domain-containing protein [Actinomycetota bacterium]